MKNFDLEKDYAKVKGIEVEMRFIVPKDFTSREFRQFIRRLEDYVEEFLGDRIVDYAGTSSKEVNLSEVQNNKLLHGKAKAIILKAIAAGKSPQDVLPELANLFAAEVGMIDENGNKVSAKPNETEKKLSAKEAEDKAKKILKDITDISPEDILKGDK